MTKDIKEKLKNINVKGAIKHRVVVLKTAQLTNYHYVQDHAFSIRPLYLKNV